MYEEPDSIPSEYGRPAGLCPKGYEAWKIIISFLYSHDLLGSGGQPAVFYSPQQWKDRGELYGEDSVLIVVHDGGNHAQAFKGEDEEIIVALVEKLGEAGFYPQDCTCWYTAIYPH